MWAGGSVVSIRSSEQECGGSISAEGKICHCRGEKQCRGDNNLRCTSPGRRMQEGFTGGMWNRRTNNRSCVLVVCGTAGRIMWWNDRRRGLLYWWYHVELPPDDYRTCPKILEVFRNQNHKSPVVPANECERSLKFSHCKSLIVFLSLITYFLSRSSNNNHTNWCRKFVVKQNSWYN